MPSDEELRSNGFMTIDEFLTKFSLGLKEHLHNTWRGIDTGDLHHPEDLASMPLPMLKMYSKS